MHRLKILNVLVGKQVKNQKLNIVKDGKLTILVLNMLIKNSGLELTIMFDWNPDSTFSR